jgi:large-conductance mechanosensitive channel
MLKLVVFAVIYCKNREIANTYNTAVLITVAVCHLGLWIYSIVLFGNEELGVCHLRDQFFMKSYVFAYGAMIVGGVCFFLILIVPAIIVTVRTFRNAKKEKEEEEG